MAYRVTPQVFSLKKGDLRPALAIVVMLGDAVLDLTAAAVTFTMRNRATGALKVSAQTATITAAATGRVEYRWAGTDTDTAGIYDAEFIVTLPGSLPVSVPGDSYIEVQVLDRLT